LSGTRRTPKRDWIQFTEIKLGRLDLGPCLRYPSFVKHLIIEKIAKPEKNIPKAIPSKTK